MPQDGRRVAAGRTNGGRSLDRRAHRYATQAPRTRAAPGVRRFRPADRDRSLLGEVGRVDHTTKIPQCRNERPAIPTWPVGARCRPDVYRRSADRSILPESGGRPL